MSGSYRLPRSHAEWKWTGNEATHDTAMLHMAPKLLGGSPWDSPTDSISLYEY